MKFFHVYNEDCYVGLEKNGLLNKDTGFKIQHAFSVPGERKFNNYAAKGSKLHSLIKENKIPFYVDRIAGGITWHNYEFDRALIQEYVDLLGDWFLGFQLHESASNRRKSDWASILHLMDGSHGPYDVEVLREKKRLTKTNIEDGEVLYGFSQDRPETYAQMKYAETPAEYIEEIKDLFRRRMADVDGRILPCDSYFMATKLQDELGMHTFMPEVGCQIPLMRQQVALARGMAKASGKTWGTYYECWREVRDSGSPYYCMPCFNTDKSNEWYLSQEQHGDDFTTFGENGGSSRILQNRIYYYALMSGADYFSEEWGLNCSYTDMQDFSLSDYGRVKKDFINTALDFQGVKATVPFAIVLPTDYACMEIPEIWDEYEFGKPRDVYLFTPISDSEKAYYGHIEELLKLCYLEKNPIGNESHTITNSHMPDVFDIIYADASDEALAQYAYLIDATPTGEFAKAKAGSGLKVLESGDLGKLKAELKDLIKEAMPCYVDELCWLVSTDANGKRYLSIFNNDGNERNLLKGNIIHREADKEVTITFKEKTIPHVLKETMGSICLEKVDDLTYKATIPAAGFAIINF